MYPHTHEEWNINVGENWGEVCNKNTNSQQLMKQGIELIIFYSFGKSVAWRDMQLKKQTLHNQWNKNIKPIIFLPICKEGDDLRHALCLDDYTFKNLTSLDTLDHPTNL
jgi:hypothetical protein